MVTDVLVLDIDLRGGTLVHAELPGYPLIKGQPEPVVLFNQADPSKLTTCCRPASRIRSNSAPSHTSRFSPAAASRIELAAGQDELRVPLTWTDGEGVTVTKTFVFHRGMFAIGLEYAVRNQSAIAVVGCLVRAHFARRSGDRTLHVQGRVLRIPRPGHLRHERQEYAYHDSTSKRPTTTQLSRT